MAICDNIRLKKMLKPPPPIEPIQKKAEDAIQAVSRDNGYAFVFEKDNLHVYPPSTDILPLVKKKLGLL